MITGRGLQQATRKAEWQGERLETLTWEWGVSRHLPPVLVPLKPAQRSGKRRLKASTKLQCGSRAFLNTLQETGMTIKLTGLPWWLRGKEQACQFRRRGFSPWSGRSPGEGNGNLTPVFLPGEFHGQRSLVGNNSPWGCQRVRHDLVTKQCQTSCRLSPKSPGGSSQDHLQ